jgi:hypothetical protein
MSLESKLSTSIQELKTELKTDAERTRTELKTAMERTKAEVVRWVFLTMLGNVALGAGAAAVLHAFK